MRLANKAKDSAATLTTSSAVYGALTGQCRQAGDDIRAALGLAQTKEVLMQAVTASAFCGDASHTASASVELSKLYPKDSRLNEVFLPSFHAVLDSRRGAPAKAVQTDPYGGGQGLMLRYSHGTLYLGQHMGTEAAAEFQWILDHRGRDAFSIVYPLAHLGLARAAALTGDLAKSRKACQEFFALWKDADPDLPVLLEAKREYQKL